MSKDDGSQAHLKVSERDADNGVNESWQKLSGGNTGQQESSKCGSHVDEGSEDANSRNNEGSAATKAKDAVKRKRASKTAKLKQCKLDARQKQWLSSVSAGQRRQGSQPPASTATEAGGRVDGGGASICQSEECCREAERRDPLSSVLNDCNKHGEASNSCWNNVEEESVCRGVDGTEGSLPHNCSSQEGCNGKAPLRQDSCGELLASSAEEHRSPLNLSREMLQCTELASEPMASWMSSGKALNVEWSDNLDAERESMQKMDPPVNGSQGRSRTNGYRSGSHAAVAGRSQGPGSCGGKRGGTDTSLSSCTESCGGSTSASSCTNSCAGSSGAGSGSDDNDEPVHRNGHHRNGGVGPSLKGDSEVDDWEALYVVPEENEKQSDIAPDHPAEVEGGESLVGKGRATSPGTMARDVSLKPDYKYHGRTVGSQMRTQGGPPRAWRPDDVSRPPTLPRLAKQHSYPLHAAAPWGGAFNGSVWGLQPPAPEYCPVCTEEMDTTDASFLPCSCGFRICLFCHHRIVLGDGRCPGCRKAYATTEVKLSRSPSLWLRPNRGAPLLS